MHEFLCCSCLGVIVSVAAILSAENTGNHWGGQHCVPNPARRVYMRCLLHAISGVTMRMAAVSPKNYFAVVLCSLCTKSLVTGLRLTARR